MDRASSSVYGFSDDAPPRVSPITCCLMLLILVLLLSRDTKALQVIGGTATVLQGESATLPCKLIDTEETLAQISWQRKTRNKPLKDNFYTIQSSNKPSFVNGDDDRFTFIGSFKDRIGSLQLSNVTLGDEGTYTCIFTLFPSGNSKTEIPLNVLVPPFTSLRDNNLTLGDEEVSLATCTAAGSRPSAEVKWLIGTLADKVKEITKSTEHANGTTTTVSTLFGVPTREINNHLVQCVITTTAPLEEKTLSLNIQVYFPPMEVNITETSKDTFQCVTAANPAANFAWTRADQPLPSAVTVEGGKLQFLTMTSDLNGLYQCEASNPYGRKHHHLYVHVASGSCTVCWTLFGLSFISLVAGAAGALYLYRYGKFPRTGEGTRGDMHNVPTSCSTEEEEARGL